MHIHIYFFLLIFYYFILLCEYVYFIHVFFIIFIMEKCKNMQSIILVFFKISNEANVCSANAMAVHISSID